MANHNPFGSRRESASEDPRREDISGRSSSEARLELEKIRRFFSRYCKRYHNMYQKSSIIYIIHINIIHNIHSIVNFQNCSRGRCTRRHFLGRRNIQLHSRTKKPPSRIQLPYVFSQITTHPRSVCTLANAIAIHPLENHHPSSQYVTCALANAITIHPVENCKPHSQHIDEEPPLRGLNSNEIKIRNQEQWRQDRLLVSS
jgi:hypothetical protein